MQLSPLQSRLAASAVATILLIIIYLSLFPPQFALAEEIHHETPIILDDNTAWDVRDAELEAGGGTYEPEFAAFDRSILGSVAKRDIISLTNNVPNKMNLNAGQTLVYHFDSSQLSSREENEAFPLEPHGESAVLDEEGGAFVDWDGELKLSKRATTRTVYISANTCLQPSSNSTTATEPPQLTLYVSNSTNNTSPGPSADASEQEERKFTEGAVMLSLNTSTGLYIGVSANNVSSNFSGIYNFQIAASINAYYHSYNESMADELYWVDSDTTSVLLITQNLTTSRDEEVEEGFMASRPYVMFAQNDDDPSINGMRNSYCGLNNNAQIAAVRNGQDTTQVTTGITRRGAGGYPKQQFYFSGLNASSKYQGILAKNANATTNTNVPGGGGHVLRYTTFETKSTGANCNLVFNLSFCDEVAYAVPSNPNTFPNTTLLGEFYDNYARSLYDGFNKSMAQVPCEAPESQQFSLVRNCTTCQSAYKDWLCSVTIPRCEDFSSTDSWLQPRAINQTFPDGSSPDADSLSQYAAYKNQSSFLSSRNPLIDSVVKPGPYKEVLPCAELCYDLVQSCPASLSFACPRPWMMGFNTSYGTKSPASDKGNITCNYPGSFHYYAGAAGLAVPWLLASGFFLLASSVVW